MRKKKNKQQHKDAACCFEQILEASPFRTTFVQPLTPHFAYHPSKTSKTCDKLIGNVPLKPPTHGHTCVDRTEKTYIHHLWADTGCRLEDLSRAMPDRVEWRERDRE